MCGLFGYVGQGDIVAAHTGEFAVTANAARAGRGDAEEKRRGGRADAYPRSDPVAVDRVLRRARTRLRRGPAAQPCQERDSRVVLAVVLRFARNDFPGDLPDAGTRPAKPFFLRFAS